MVYKAAFDLNSIVSLYNLFKTLAELSQNNILRKKLTKTVARNKSDWMSKNLHKPGDNVTVIAEVADRPGADQRLVNIRKIHPNCY